MSLFRFFKDEPAVKPRWRIRVTEPCRITNEHRDRGDVIDLDAEEARLLVGDGRAEKLAVLDSAGEPLPGGATAPTPPARNTPEPLPDDWKDLPSEFARAWELLARRRALSADVRDAEEFALPAVTKARRDYARARGEDATKYEPLIRTISPEEAQRSLTTNIFVIEARERLTAFDEGHAADLGRALVAAGRIAAAEILGVDAARKRCAALGLDLFGLRVAALELHQNKVGELFRGSVLWERFANTPSLDLGDVTFTGGPNPGHALDVPLASMAARYREALTRRAEIDAIIADGQAQLAKAQGVTAKVNKRAA